MLRYQNKHTTQSLTDFAAEIFMSCIVLSSMFALVASVFSTLFNCLFQHVQVSGRQEAVFTAVLRAARESQPQLVASVLSTLYNCLFQHVQVSGRQEPVFTAVPRAARESQPQLLHRGHVLRGVRRHRAHRDIPHRRAGSGERGVGATLRTSPRRKAGLRGRPGPTPGNIYKMFYLHVSSLSEYSAQRQVFHCQLRNQGCSFTRDE